MLLWGVGFAISGESAIMFWVETIMVIELCVLAVVIALAAIARVAQVGVQCA